MCKQKLTSLQFELAIPLLAIPTTIFILTQSIYAGDIEQILPATSNFTIDGDGPAEVMRVQSDGKVGIGTTTPNEKLEVNGHIRMTDGNEAANTVMIGDADGTASWADISALQNGINTDDQALQDFNLTDNILSIALEDGGTLTVDLSALNNAAAVTAVQANLDTHLANDGDTDATNELNTNVALNGTTLEVTDAGGTQGADLDTTFATDAELSALATTVGNDGDTNASNELQDLTLTDTTLSIENGNDVNLGDTFATNTAVNALATTVANDADTDPANEVNTQLTLNGTALEITDSAGTLSQDLNGTFATDAELSALATTVGNDGDTDATNELNTNVALNGTTLEVTDAGGTQGTDLDITFATDAETSAAIVASAALDLDKDPANEIQTITSNNNSVALVKTGNDYDLSVNIPTQTVTTLTQEAAPNQLAYKYTSENATETTIKSSPIVGFGKVNGAGALQRGYGATVSRNSIGNYTVTLDNARPSANYTIQLTIVDSNGAGNDDYDISYSNQTTNSFVVQTGDNDNGGGDRATRDSEFMFTVIDY